MDSAKGHRNNHYVPIWYQNRFLPDSFKERKFRYLDLSPEVTIDAKGRSHRKSDLKRWGPKRCFCQEDLYTSKIGSIFSTDIEKKFFSRIDDTGSQAIEFWSNLNRYGIDENNFNTLIQYMTLQRLRTPKGLAYIAAKTQSRSHNLVLRYLQQLQWLYGAIWAEAEWAIADASESNTKFIISDNPVTVYNIGCFPGSAICKPPGDPEPWLAATHTYFPLSLDKILILTNTTWVRNPYGNPLKARPNPSPARSTIFKTTKIQTGRSLSEQEVREINYITKKRALRYIASPVEEWLYPEKYLSTTHWSKLGRGLLFMPDPREVEFSSQIIVGGYKDGRPADVWDEYGRRPGQSTFNDEKFRAKEWRTFHAFKGEFARLMGPERRGVAHSIGTRHRTADSPEHHASLLKGEIPQLSRKRRGA